MIFNFEEGSGFSAFAMFNALKLHFTTDSYDYIRYHGKSNVTADNFASRKDKYSFYKLSRKYRLEDLKNFYVANLLEKDVNWIGDINNLDGEETYKKWQKRNQSLTYHFEQDIIHLLNDTQSPNQMLMVEDGQYPSLLKEVMYSSIAVETLVILNDIMNFFPMWDKKIADTIVWPSMRRKFVKYTPFIDYDKEKFRLILKETLKEYA
jgi:hypothetical protein